MEHQRTGRLHWDTTHAATPGWLLFLEAQPEDLLTMRPWLETRLPADASTAEGRAPTNTGNCSNAKPGIAPRRCRSPSVQTAPAMRLSPPSRTPPERGARVPS